MNLSKKDGMGSVEIAAIILVIALVIAIAVPVLIDIIHNAQEEAEKAEARSAILAVQTLASDTNSVGNFELYFDKTIDKKNNFSTYELSPEGEKAYQDLLDPGAKYADDKDIKNKSSQDEMGKVESVTIDDTGRVCGALYKTLHGSEIVYYNGKYLVLSLEY